jgi:D-alanine--poly(phosphoribitol) ligase subunit 2
MDQAQLLDILAEITGTDEVRVNLQLELFETQVLDSMRVVELIVRIDEAFSVSVSPADFDRTSWATPEKFLADVEARLVAAA